MIKQNINCRFNISQMLFTFSYPNHSPQRRRGHRDFLKGLSALCDSAVSIFNRYFSTYYKIHQLMMFSIPSFSHESTLATFSGTEHIPKGIHSKTRNHLFRVLRVLRGKYKNDTKNNINDTKVDTKEIRLDNILDLIKSNNSITLIELSECLNISKSTILRDFDKLKKMGKLKFIGEKRTSHWEIIEND